MLRQVPGTNRELSPAAIHGYLVSPLPRLTSINSSLNQSLNLSINQSFSSKSSDARIASDFLSPIAKIFNELKSQGGNSPQSTWQAANHQTCDSDKSVNESHNRNELGFNFNVNNCENSRKSQLSETILKTHDISIPQTSSHAPSEFDVLSVGPGEEQYFSKKLQQVSLDFRESFDEAFEPDVMKNKHSRFILNADEKAEESEQLHSLQEIDPEGTEEYSVDDEGDENFILLEENQFYSLDEEDPSGKEKKLNGKFSNGGRKKLGRKRTKGVSKVPLVEKEANAETPSHEDGANAVKIIEQFKNYDVAIQAFEEMQPQRNTEAIELHKWIIKPVPNSKGVCVEGMKDNSDQFWHSSAILKRLSAKRVISNSGTVYKLVGNIVKLDALDAGYPLEVVNAFKHGFPKDWQETLQEYCNPDRIKMKTNETSRSLQKPNEKHTKNQNFKSPNRSLKRKSGKTEPPLDTPTSSTSTSEFEICTPTGQIVNIKNLNRTKCGRLVKPVLSWWVGQSITQSGDDIQVTCNTKYGEMELTALKDQVKNSKKMICRRVLVKNDVSFSKNSSPTAKKTDSGITQSSRSQAKTMNFKSKHSGKEPQGDQKSKDDSTYFDVQARVNDIIQHHQEKVKSKRQPKRNTCYNNTKDSRPSNMEDDVFSIDNAKDDFEEEKLQRRIRTTKNIKNPGPNRSESSYKTSTKTCSTSVDMQTISGTGKGAKSNKSVSRKKSVCKRKTSSGKSKQQVVVTSVESNTDIKNPAVNTKDDKKSASESNVVDSGQKRITRSMNRSATSSRSTVNNNSVLHEDRSKNLEAIPASDGVSEMITQNGGNYQSRTKISTRTKRSSASGSLNGAKNKGGLDGTKNKVSLDGTKNKVSLDGTKNKVSLDGTKNKDSLDGTNNKDNETLGNGKSNKRIISGARSNENDRVWQKDEVQKLESAVDKLQQGQSGYWETVARHVGTRSVQECQDYYYREFPQLAKKQKKERKEDKKKVTQLTGKAGTLKRKNQLRDFLDQQQEGYSEDLFDATPFRSHNKRQRLNDNNMGMNGANMKDEDEEGIFDELIKRRSSLHSRFQTPLVQNKNPRFLNLASEKKTPAVISNVFTPSVDLDRKTADHIIYQFKQKKGPRRLIGTQKIAPKVKKRKVSDIPNRSLFGKSAPDVLQLFQDKQNDSMEIHQDSDEEQDFYWSDQD
ncbi:hypothetical protein CHS0354_007397 [Potamilus streckersoni]|uniref:Myb-like domain-containing protein n=1 Tax=Potamilus streckersoni TaxID=2493646 RepID=A0AAE0W019_9BIVA|nr:hypothetical protein CHS0354_007397 [Potamilus streckersoni]